MNNKPNNDPPAARLEGMSLDDDWKVVEMIRDRTPSQTGGCFSYQYLVQQDGGRRAFLKALDFSGALQSPDPAGALSELTAAFTFERGLLDTCKDKKMSRVVKIVSGGAVTVEPGGAVDRVQYLIFELADGDVRSHLDRAKSVGHSWTLRTLHHIALGLRQLHSAEIAHQDLKPSNVLIFSEEECSKIADLGRACKKQTPTSIDGLGVPGDQGYAPPELLYSHLDPDWGRRRIGCDAYLFGSLVVFLFSKVTANGLLYSGLDPRFHYSNWASTFEDVLPYLQRSFADALRMVESEFPAPWAAELTRIVSELCNPDPQRRHPPRQPSRVGSPLLMDYYVSRLDDLAGQAEFQERGAPK